MKCWPKRRDEENKTESCSCFLGRCTWTFNRARRYTTVYRPYMIMIVRSAECVSEYIPAGIQDEDEGKILIIIVQKSSISIIHLFIVEPTLHGQTLSASLRFGCLSSFISTQRFTFFIKKSFNPPCTKQTLQVSGALSSTPSAKRTKRNLYLDVVN